ncbi:MAG: FAD-binding oxidoreductase [Deltaproteobacteria bacterium]|nr:FAD-binding oxidoreductase [Deltaproteobacteria bacterium]
MPPGADLVVIGGGIMGLATAYHAARLGVRRVVVLEKSYLCSGASGRNGGGVRMQWSSRDNILLMRESVEICRRFAADMGFNVWFRQGGYLFLVRKPELVPVLEKNVALQNELGVRTRILNRPEAAHEIVPGLNVEGVVSASYNPDDGVLFPWPFVWGYAHKALELGVHIHTFTEVTALRLHDGMITHVETTRGTIAAGHVVNAAGAWSPSIAKMAGVSIPNQPYRHEILTTEPLKPFLDPMVTVLGEGVYFSQSMRGEIVGGMGDPDETSSHDTSSSLDFLRRFARSATQLLPALGNVQVVRQWAGSYDVSPDGRPILGESKRAANMTILAGFTGHGFMMGPVIGKLCAERLVMSSSDDYFDQNGPDRFEDGVGPNHESMIIG